MGTNFYLKRKDEEREPCPTCGQLPPLDVPPRLHIGKSSGGWCFSLRVYPDDGDAFEEPVGFPESLEDWKARFADERCFIEDEYGRVITAEDMLARITERAGSERALPDGYRSWHEFHHRNNSEPGPGNLLRHVADGTHCVGHGGGTWDLIAGEFS